MKEKHDGFCGMDFDTWLRSLTNEERDILAEHFIVDLLYSDGGEVIYSQDGSGKKTPKLYTVSGKAIANLEGIQSCEFGLVSSNAKSIIRKKVEEQPGNFNICYRTLEA